MRTESLKYRGILTILSHLLCFPVSFIIYDLKPLFFGEPAQVTTKTVNVFMKQQLKQCTLKHSVVFIAQSDKVQNIFVHPLFLNQNQFNYSRDIFMNKKNWLFSGEIKYFSIKLPYVWHIFSILFRTHQHCSGTFKSTELNLNVFTYQSIVYIMEQNRQFCYKLLTFIYQQILILKK